jgi:lantibiotic modifying enzyme
LGELVLKWMIDSACVTDAGVAWKPTRTSQDLDPTLYSGSSGVVMTLLEAHCHFGDVRFADIAIAASRELSHASESWSDCSLYFGITGMAVALQSVYEVLGDSSSRSSVQRIMERVRTQFDGERWGTQFELLGGNAGIALGALRVGDLDLAITAVTPYVERAEPTPAGVHWEHRKGVTERLHHISHGTLGIVEALAAVGYVANRTDFIEVALAGAADIVSRNEASNDGFLVPHSDPQYRPDLVERYSYGWCHGPSGDAQVFRLLAAVTADPAWMDLTDGCWRTVVTSGLPDRIRPGFWDNSGRCCGTSGVLAFALDRHVERGEDLSFAGVLVEDLFARATIDAEGARWSNFEYRETPSELEPRIGWAMGNAGIVKELLRYSRLQEGRSQNYYIPWPDQPSIGPRAFGAGDSVVLL